MTPIKRSWPVRSVSKQTNQIHLQFCLKATIARLPILLNVPWWNGPTEKSRRIFSNPGHEAQVTLSHLSSCRAPIFQKRGPWDSLRQNSDDSSVLMRQNYKSCLTKAYSQTTKARFNSFCNGKRDDKGKLTTVRTTSDRYQLFVTKPHFRISIAPTQHRSFFWNWPLHSLQSWGVQLKLHIYLLRTIKSELDKSVIVQWVDTVKNYSILENSFPRKLIGISLKKRIGQKQPRVIWLLLIS